MSISKTTEYTFLHVAIIVAMTKDHVIGSGEDLPWHLPEDLQLFKTITTGGTVIMGRKTYDTIGSPLSGRHNIVLSRSDSDLPGVQTSKSFIGALAVAAKIGKPIFVIGGEELYRKALPIASEIHASWINDDFSGDVHFPEFDLNDWEVSEEKVYAGFHYVRYLRKKL